LVSGAAVGVGATVGGAGGLVGAAVGAGLAAAAGALVAGGFVGGALVGGGLGDGAAGAQAVASSKDAPRIRAATPRVLVTAAMVGPARLGCQLATHGAGGTICPPDTVASTQSFLAALSPAARDRLMSDAIRLDIPAGAVAYRDWDTPRTALVVEGLLRVYLQSSHGRQTTLRYARAGDVIGAPVAVGGPVGVSVQALTDTSVLIFNMAMLQSLGQSDAAFAWAVAEEVTRRLYEVIEAFAGNAFGSVRQRIARQLLDLAAEQQRDAGLIARVTQQELADATGTVREVAARVLRQMRDQGLVDTTRDGILVLDPTGLQREAEVDGR
jgi:CRP/FNR family transcriptional regulator, cyclic AMP receptor protein